MKRAVKTFLDPIVAVLLISAIICGSVFVSFGVKSSPLYRQSRVISMLIRQEPVGVAEMLGDTRNIDMAVKFAGALTAAYINFELIPVGEAATFAAVFESLPDGVDIESFEYRRKDLYIIAAANDEAYRAFIKELLKRDHFSSVSGRSLYSEGDKALYEIICYPQTAETHIYLYQSLLT